MKKILFSLFSFLILNMLTAQGKTLVTYYSYTGNVKSIVDELIKAQNADVVEILPAEEGLKYEADNYAIGSALISAIRNNPDVAESYPSIKPTNIDFDKYDNIIIATPLWWSNMAAPMQSFLFENGKYMEGKNIGLIVSSSSSGIQSVIADAKRLVPEGKFSNESLWINDKNRSNMASLLGDWITTLNFTNYMAEKLLITIGNKTLTASLLDNSSSQAIVASLKKSPISYEAHDYGNFEKVGSLGETFPTNDEQITTEPGDLILYQGENLCIYYDVNSWNFTRIGKIDNITQSELKDFLGNGNCTITISLSSDSKINDIPSSKSTDLTYDILGRKARYPSDDGIYVIGGKKLIKH